MCRAYVLELLTTIPPVHALVKMFSTSGNETSRSFLSIALRNTPGGGSKSSGGCVSGDGDVVAFVERISSGNYSK